MCERKKKRERERKRERKKKRERKRERKKKREEGRVCMCVDFLPYVFPTRWFSEVRQCI